MAPADMGILDRAMSAARRSLWFRLLLPVGTVLSVTVAVEAIIPRSGPGSVAATIALLAPLFYRFRRALGLPKKQRMLFYDVLRSGQACAEPEINELVREDLARAVSNRPTGAPTRSDKIALVVLTVMPVVLAVVAAFLRSPWWLLAMVGTPLMVLYKNSQPSGDPRQRLERLLATMGPAD